jgi:hypothetical protein
MSRYLRVLRRTGLVEGKCVEHDTRVKVYRLRRQRFTELRSWVDGVETFWSNPLAAFKTHAERRRR